MKTAVPLLHWLSLFLLPQLILGSHLATAHPQSSGPNDCGAPLFDGLGDHHFEITTSSDLAQKYFNQGIIWTYGFNHGEAEKSFRKAAELDPECAMCFWGVSYVLGPNINRAMPDEAVEPAYEALQQAVALKDKVTARERDFIEALAHRYHAAAVADRSPLDRAYAEAMAKVAAKHPDDVDALTLYAEALMDTTPWNYYTPSGEPKEVTLKILAALEAAIQRNRHHPGANHYYIHTVESVQPQRGETAADNLMNLVPAAGHLQHMPSHIYIRIGRYHDASKANQRAIAADEAYLAGCHVSGFYEMMYIPHDYDFLAAAAFFEGRFKLALDASQDLKRYIEPHLNHMPQMVDFQQFASTPLLMLIRFGRWQDILAYPAPEDHMDFARGLWHFSRALAYTRLGQHQSAEAEISLLEERAAKASMADSLLMNLNSARSVLAVGIQEAKGELAASQGDYEGAIAHLRRAVQLQDGLVYIEPPPWYHSVRLALGAVLLDAGQPKEAERVFREDLTQFANNGWALFGLHQSLLLQGRKDAASQVKERFKKAWRYADVTLRSARF